MLGVFACFSEWTYDKIRHHDISVCLLDFFFFLSDKKQHTVYCCKLNQKELLQYFMLILNKISISIKSLQNINYSLQPLLGLYPPKQNILKCKYFFLYSQFVSFKSSMVQEVEASVILLSKVNIGHHNQDLDNISEIFSDCIMEGRVPIRILSQEKKQWSM